MIDFFSWLETKKKMYSKYLKINSAFRTSGLSHDFRIDLPTSLRGKSMKLSQVYILNTFYNINENNNKFYFRVKNKELTTAHVAVGNYDSLSFPSALKNALDEVGNGNLFSVSTNNITNKLEITCSATVQILMGSNTHQSLRDVCGFDGDGFYASTHTAQNILNLSPIMSFNISLNDIPVIDQAGNQYPTTFCVPVQEGFKNIIDITPGTQGFTQVVSLPHKTRSIKVSVRDDNYNLLDLNGANWYMILERNNTYDEEHMDMDFT